MRLQTFAKEKYVPPAASPNQTEAGCADKVVSQDPHFRIFQICRQAQTTYACKAYLIYINLSQWSQFSESFSLFSSSYLP